MSRRRWSTRGWSTSAATARSPAWTRRPASSTTTSGSTPSAYRASPVAADGNIYLTARDGVVTVVKAGPKFEEIAVNRLPDSLYASPAISNGRIYLRGFATLYAIGETGK